MSVVLGQTHHAEAAIEPAHNLHRRRVGDEVLQLSPEKEVEEY